MAKLMAGGALLGAALSALLKTLTSRHVVDFFWRKKLDEGLLKKFKIELLAVNVLLDDAEMKEFSDQKVREWLNEIKDAIYHAEDVLDEIYTMATKPKTKWGLTKTKLNAGRVEEIIEKLHVIVSQKDLLGLNEGVRDNLIRREPTTSLAEDTFIGRDMEVQKIIEVLLTDVAVGDQIPVKAIVGMGGIGKTTVAKVVYNNEKVEEYFDTKAWVCVTEEFDVFRMTQIILETLTSSHSDITDLNLLQLKLMNKLTGKKILLVLDDVWNQDYSKWRILCASFTYVSSGSKILVTTRDESVAAIMRTTPSHSLEPLLYEDCLDLFAHHAFESRNRHCYRHLEVIGKLIVEKCQGLPLAIKSLGGVLRNKEDVKVWENVLNSEIWDLSIGKTSTLPALRVSYHYLPAHIKRCFAYCSIFPQGHEFVKELVLLWMAEGFIPDNTDKCMEDLGEEYFDELLSRSFFQKPSSQFDEFVPQSFIQKSSSRFVMHGLNNDLAKYVSGKFCLNLERSNTWQFSEKVRHFSYFKDEYDDYNKFKPILEAKYLRTFLPTNFL